MQSYGVRDPLGVRARRLLLVPPFPSTLETTIIPFLSLPIPMLNNCFPVPIPSPNPQNQENYTKSLESLNTQDKTRCARLGHYRTK